MGRTCTIPQWELDVISKYLTLLGPTEVQRRFLPHRTAASIVKLARRRLNIAPPAAILELSEEEDPVAMKPFVHRVVPAGEWKVDHKLGPASVFDLASK